MTFFYDLNKRLANLGKQQEQISESVEKAAAKKSPVQKTLEQALRTDLKSLMEDGTGGQSQSNTLEAKADYSAKKAAAGKDIGKPGKNFAKIAAKSGGGEKGQKIAGAVLAKLRAAKESVEEASETMEAGAGGIHGRMPDPMTQKDQQKKMNPPRSLEEKDESEEDIMDYLNRKLAPHDKQQQAKEDACAVPYNKGSGKPDAKNGMEFEGNAFTGKLASTPKGGEFELDGEEYKDTSSLEETVSRKHFQQVADLLRNIPDEAKRKEMAMHHASIFKQQNPRFDMRRFAAAAGVDLEECAMWEELKGGQVKLDKNHNGKLDANDFAQLRGDAEVDEGFADMDRWLAQREKEKGTGKFDSRKVSTGTVYTRKPETFDMDDPETDPEATGGAPKRGRGRPASTKPVEKRVTKGAWKHKVAEEGEEEVDEEKQEAGKRKFFDKLAPAAKKVAKVVGAVTKGKKEVDEESTAKKDTKAEKAGKKVAKDIEHDEGHKGKDDNKAEKAGKKVTKDIEYDDKKDKKEKEEKVDETTTSGSVATAMPSASKGASQVGKGIYDSWNRQYQSLLAESVNVSQESAKMEDGNEEESITINVTGDDVARFKEVLASMGLGQQAGVQDTMHAHDDSCGTCGGTPCQCDELVADEGIAGQAAGTIAGGAFGGPVGAAIGGAIGNNLTDEDDVEEGNEFSGELAKAKAQHKDEFEVDGKTYPVKEADAPVPHKDSNDCDYSEDDDGNPTWTCCGHTFKLQGDHSQGETFIDGKFAGQYETSDSGTRKFYDASMKPMFSSSIDDDSKIAEFLKSKFGDTVKEADAPVSQNSPDYPTNQEYDDDALQYSGGLNRRKSTGQSTIPVVASQEDRLHTMEESVDSFLNLYKAFAKTK